MKSNLLMRLLNSLAVFILLMTGLYSCSSNEKVSTNLRIPNSLNPRLPGEIDQDLLAASSWIKNEALRGEWDVSACHSFLRDGYEKIFYLPSDHFQTDYNIAEWGAIIENLWIARKEIRKHMQRWYRQGELSKECSGNVKSAFRAFRFIEDYASLQYMKKKDKQISGFNIENDPHIFSKPFPFTLTDDLKDEINRDQDIKSGDILMWRGKSTISGSIARIGEVENNFPISVSST